MWNFNFQHTFFVSPTEREIPIPPPRRSKQGSSPTSHHPTLLISQKEHNGSYPLPVSATNSYYSDFPSSETDDSDMPSSPGSYYSQLPTPDHPPPSPHTAMLGIQAKLSPQVSYSSFFFFFFFFFLFCFFFLYKYKPHMWVISFYECKSEQARGTYQQKKSQK